MTKKCGWLKENFDWEKLSGLNPQNFKMTILELSEVLSLTMKASGGNYMTHIVQARTII